jgi:hypothetical protein
MHASFIEYSYFYYMYVHTAESSSECDKKESNRSDRNVDGELVGPPQIVQGSVHCIYVLYLVVPKLNDIGSGIRTTLNIEALAVLEGHGRRKVRYEPLSDERKEESKIDEDQNSLSTLRVEGNTVTVIVATS